MIAEAEESRAIREADLPVGGMSEGSLTAAIEDYGSEVRRLFAKHNADVAFARPLVFGDPDQLKVLKRWRDGLARAAEDARDLVLGRLRRWTVNYSVRADRSAEVVAYTEKQAEALLTGYVSDLEEIDDTVPLGPATGTPRVDRVDIL